MVRTNLKLKLKYFNRYKDIIKLDNIITDLYNNKSVLFNGLIGHSLESEVHKTQLSFPYRLYFTSKESLINEYINLYDFLNLISDSNFDLTQSLNDTINALYTNLSVKSYDLGYTGPEQREDCSKIIFETTYNNTINVKVIDILNVVSKLYSPSVTSDFSL